MLICKPVEFEKYTRVYWSIDSTQHQANKVWAVRCSRRWSSCFRFINERHSTSLSNQIRLSCLNAAAMAEFDESLYAHVSVEEVDSFLSDHAIDKSTLHLTTLQKQETNLLTWSSWLFLFITNKMLQLQMLKHCFLLLWCSSVWKILHLLLQNWLETRDPNRRWLQSNSLL